MGKYNERTNLTLLLIDGWASIKVLTADEEDVRYLKLAPRDSIRLDEGYQFFHYFLKATGIWDAYWANLAAYPYAGNARQYGLLDSKESPELWLLRRSDLEHLIVRPFSWSQLYMEEAQKNGALFNDWGEVDAAWKEIVNQIKP